MKNNFSVGDRVFLNEDDYLYPENKYHEGVIISISGAFLEIKFDKLQFQNDPFHVDVLFRLIDIEDILDK